MKPLFTRALHAAGMVLGILGVVFVAQRLYQYAGELDVSRISHAGWWLLAMLSLIYGAANAFLAIAWRHVLRFLGEHADYGKAIRIYGLSQLAKYVPGNIFHLAGRQALGMAAGMPARALGLSAMWELGLIALAGATFGILLLPLIWPEMSLLATLMLFAVALFLLCLIGKYGLSVELANALLWQTLFLAVSGAVFLVILRLVVPPDTALLDIAVLCGAYVIASLAGLVTPGAPAGLGVREAVILLLLGNFIAPADLLLAVLLGRVITVLGDFLFFSASAVCKDG